ncbi:hypothetical protein QTN25_002213 [Entamoeba marina]
MQNKQLNNRKNIDSYSILISSKYLETEKDFINLICVNSKFKETTEKLRFNPIPINSLKLFPNIQTQYLYKKSDKIFETEQIVKYELWYHIDYEEYTKYKMRNIKCHYLEYTEKNRKAYGNEIPDCVIILGKYCFQRCYSFSTINLPSSLKSLGNGCFRGCSTLSFINLPSSLTSLGYGCFNDCSTLSSINLPSSLISLGNQCFSGCSSLSSINLPSSLSLLGYGCFSGCSTLSSINLPSSLKSLGDECFRECYSLSTIDLPSSLTSFGRSCFGGCEQLEGLINVPDYCFDNPFLFELF